uniref:phosphoglycerate mutase (2,3-diphosphoglycerate-dependent) n=1 Tax=Kalanchoe fedtschenkoi TaxID=63787 RepID=A0A7N0TLE7_KALFE
MAVASYQAIGSIQPCRYPGGSGVPQERKNAFPKLSSGSLKFDASKAHRSSRKRSVCVVGASSSSQTSVFEPVVTPSKGVANESKKKSSEVALILIRHGESLWNEKNLFTGCVDVPLTKKGVEEALEAGKRICNIPVDMIYTSALIRAQMTAMLAMTQHRRKKVPIVLQEESEQARAWSQVFSEETRKQSIPVVRAWQLNERMYGELQGLNKQETADKYGKEKVHEWCRSYVVPPPNGESLEMCAERAVAYFRENVISLELATGIPMLYIFKEGKFIRRGSPAGPAEAGVYAYTRTLAQYRQKLDEIQN